MNVDVGTGSALNADDECYPCDPVENIEGIFQLRLPYRKKPRNGSDSTRSPAFHDQHLSDVLRLKKTVFCPNLPEMFAMMAKDSLKKATFPSSTRGSGWILAPDLERRVGAGTRSAITAEPDVVTSYHKNVFDYIVPIVSVLEFPSTSWDTQFLEISTTNSRRGQQNNYALPDSVLRIIPDQHHEAILPHSEILEAMNTVAKYFEQIIPFEFKSLSSGSYSTMLGILGHTLMNAFPWEGCTELLYCAYEHGPKLGRKPVTGDPLGFDAALPGFNLRTSDWVGKNREAFQEIRDKKTPIRHGRDMLQQIWAEMVKCDATYSMLHAGNYELLLFRNRREQTLYISDIIEPHSIGREIPGNPGYYQIQIGLYVSAIRDAISRARQLKEFGGTEDILPDTWTRSYDRGGKNKPGPTPQLPFHDVMSEYMELCLAPARNESRTFHYVEKRPYVRSCKPKGAQSKFFFLETSDHTTPNELIGTLIMNEHTFKLSPVVIKVASGKLETRRLYNEYLKHSHFSKMSMRKQDVMIQKAYGLFKRMEGDFTESILLLEYVGKPVPLLKNLTPYQWIVIQKTLQAIHDKGFVHGALSRHNIVMKESQPGRKKGRSRQEEERPWLTDLKYMRKEENVAVRRKETRKLQQLCNANENDAPSRSWPIEFGPLPSNIENARAAFDSLTYWMARELWLQRARCKIKEGRENEWLPEPRLVVKLPSQERVMEFLDAWINRPPELEGITCEDTSFNQNSRESSQAYSPAYSGPDIMESSQASSAMAIDD